MYNLINFGMHVSLNRVKHIFNKIFIEIKPCFYHRKPTVHNAIAVQ